MMTITTTQSLQIFLRALEGQNFSPKTLRAYGDDLAQFFLWVEKNRVDFDNPTRFTRGDIEGFMQYLAAKRLTGVTRVRKLGVSPK
jgi:site-specific recombinase XerD